MTTDESAGETVGVLQPFDHRRPAGPHRVPRIECGRCGHEHHIDAAAGEYLGRCSECSAYLRRPTDVEEQQFYDFMVWKDSHVRAGR